MNKFILNEEQFNEVKKRMDHIRLEAEDKKIFGLTIKALKARKMLIKACIEYCDDPSLLFRKK